MILSNAGYIMFKAQASKGSITTPDIAVPFISDEFKTTQRISNLSNNDDINIEHIKEFHTEKIGFSSNARPDLTCYLFAYLLGADSKAGGGDPYTHTLTHSMDSRPWMTFQRKLDTNVVQQLQDCKFETITLSGEAGKPVKIAVSGTSLADGTLVTTTEQTPSYETRKPFMFYHGDGNFEFAGSTENFIKAFEITFKVGNEEQKNSEYLLVDIYDTNFEIDCSFDIYSDTTKWKNVNYYRTNAVSESVYNASCQIDLKYTENVADDRELKIELPNILWKSIDGLQLNFANNIMNGNVAGIAEKLATTDIVTVTCKNSLSSDLI